MSLFRRLLGTGLCLSAGYMIGYVQGIESIVDAVVNIVNTVGPTIPNTEPVMAGLVANLFASFAQHDVNPNDGSFWELGIVIAIFGFLLIVRGDPKPRSPEEDAPLLTHPLS